MDTDTKPDRRLRAAWNVLRGEMTTPAQLRSEWLEYQLAFDGIFDKLNTSMARIAKREQRALTKQLELIAAEPETNGATGPETNADIKARLRHHVLAQRLGGMK